MHAGVGQLLLGSEILGGILDVKATRRTAFVIAGGHALTARHCSADASDDDPLWLRLPTSEDEFVPVDLPVRVVDEDAALDVAVLGPDPGREPRGDISADSAATVLSRVPPVPVGLSGRSGEAVRTEGYPRDGRAGGLAFTGTIADPAARLTKHRAHALQLQIAELAASVPHGPGGHSGGPVLTEQGCAVGVVRAYPPDETRNYAIGGSLLATRIQDLAARFPAVREAFARRAAQVLGQASPTVRTAPSLATLIRADAHLTQFFGRKAELDLLGAWCAVDAPRAAMLMTGPAGQGKTRLARHFCARLTEAGGWVAVPLRGVGRDGEIVDGLGLAAMTGRPLLLAVDYAAEHGATELRALIDQLCAHGPPCWRLLLIARHTGDWWDGDTHAVLPALRSAGVGAAADPLSLPELVAAGDDRESAYEFILSELRGPVTAFAEQHRLPVAADPPTPPLQRPEYGSALMLHIAAVCALLPAAGPGTRSADRLDPAKVVDRFLDLERDHHWLYRDGERLHSGTAQAFGALADGEAGRYLVEAVVAAATLTGAANEVQACQLAATALNVDPQRAERIGYWLRDLYPPPAEASTSSILHPLQPDLLGEELVARVLHRQLDSGLPTEQLLPFVLITTSSEAQIQRMLTVLIRTAERHARIADLITSPGDDVTGRQPGGLLTRVLRRITRKRPQKVPAAERGGLLSRVPLDADLGIVENALPWQNIHLRRVSAQFTRRLLDRLNHVHGTGNTQATHVIAERGRLWNNLGIRLSDLGRREEALAASTEAVEIRRRLAGVNPAAFEPDLASALNNLGIRLSGLGRREEALAASTEAVQIYRRLAGVNPAAFEPDLARGLWSFAWVRAASQVELPEALNAAEESVARYESLAERLPQAFTSDLRGALASLVDVLDALGRSDEAAHVRARIDRLG
ncbi:MAG TPA: tetratricopeptide repeat protein [Pseudonocardiaceae bacterium]|nr:tetratricopeptide repeat protein [Pseudonocardiaceae bacterium]